MRRPRHMYRPKRLPTRSHAAARRAPRRRAPNAMPRGKPIAGISSDRHRPAHWVGKEGSEAVQNTGVIERFLDLFGRYIDSGFGLIGGDVGFLASARIGRS